MDINYNEIDEKCIPMVKFFNDIGLHTKFSCQGHNNTKMNDYYIMFDESITDDDINVFLTKCSNNMDHTPFIGKFIKWARKMNDGIIHSNWMYITDYGRCDLNHIAAEQDLCYMRDAYLKGEANE